MKKKNLTLSIMIFLCAALVFGFSACAHKHAHTYDRQVISENYLAEKATCTTKARYYYSCSCGEKGSGTFEFGEFIPHSFTKQDTAEKYLKSAATCTEKAVYYYSCSSCGEKGSGTFEYGGFVHPAEREWSYNETHHWHNSACACNVKVDYGEHKMDDSGCCLICKQTIISTECVVYDISADGAYAEVICYTGKPKHIKILDTYNDLPVRNIYKEAFKNAEIITVIIPDSVTSIGDQAFSGCRSLTSIIIPDSVTSIGDFVFSCCSALTSVIIPDSVSSMGYDVFCNCEKLQYNVYGNTKYLGNADNPYHALITVESKKLSAYEIHSKTKVICDSAFKGCERLASITIPESVIFIGDYTFFECKSLTRITFKGTTAQWEKIEKGSGCFSRTKDLKIYCTDGVLNAL